MRCTVYFKTKNVVFCPKNVLTHHHDHDRDWRLAAVIGENRSTNLKSIQEEEKSEK